MDNFSKEQRFWELTRGKKLITVRLDDERTVYLKNHSLDYIFSKMGFNHYMFLCSVSSYKDRELPQGLSELERQQINKEMILHVAVFLREFVQCHNVQYNESANEYRLLFEDSEKIIDLTEMDMSIIFKTFREVYCLSDGKQAYNDAKPITDRGKKFLEMMRKGKASIEAKNGGSHTIDSIIMGVTSKHNSYNLLNVWELTMWQLMQTHKIMYKIDGAYFYKIGVYTGNIDTEKSKTTNKELDWSTRTD